MAVILDTAGNATIDGLPLCDCGLTGGCDKCQPLKLAMQYRIFGGEVIIYPKPLTKQEEIRQELAKTVFLWHIGTPKMWEMGEDSTAWEGPPKKDYYEVADMIMTTLHSQGVVIKVDRELPESLYHEEEYLDPKWVEEAVKNDMLKAGYEAVEPLIPSDATC